ncbi:hypothetical protein BDV28DRAFT_43308 [Aspergillus coremiiformis]|uniref:Uncharacterized protein n=1 Tax=Aspergillus coremiiformis TaxID=138285 RepID=A0A5N6Z0V4_9EURO|nr:hypothetical protein BDV28DRAFT_43308 [Aspergillus coremiiformis]
MSPSLGTKAKRKVSCHVLQTSFPDRGCAMRWLICTDWVTRSTNPNTWTTFFFLSFFLFTSGQVVRYGKKPSRAPIPALVY